MPELFEPSQFVTGLLVALVAALIGALLTWLRTRAQKAASAREVERLQHQIDDAVQAVAGSGLWTSKLPPAFPPGYDRFFLDGIPIVTVANLKGGVGKTTICANLAWFFASQGKRVLLIDFDFQGSLSALAANEQLQDIASQLVRGEVGSPLNQLAWPLSDIGRNAQVVTAYYDLARTENEVMVRWLLDPNGDDIRYLVAKELHKPSLRRSQNAQHGFDIVLIDAAPRLTTSTVQALTASTHLLVPTILDRLSSEAVGYFLRQVLINKAIWPHLKVAGVFGSMTEFNIGKKIQAHLAAGGSQADIENLDILKNFEDRALNRINAAIDRLNDELPSSFSKDILYPIQTFIPQTVGISRAADTGIAAVTSDTGVRDDVQEAFQRLGREVAKRVGLNL